MHTLQGTHVLRFPGRTREHVQLWHESRLKSGTYARLGVFKVEYEVV
jgi:hypothetical protein